MDTITAIIRAATFGSGMVLVAVIAFRWLILLPRMVGTGWGGWAVFDPLFKRLQGLVLVLLIIQFAASVLWFWVVLANISGEGLFRCLNPKMISLGLTHTSFGLVTSFRIGAMLLVGVMLWNIRSQRWYSQPIRSGLEWMVGLLSLGLLCSLSLFGHAASSVAPGHYIHLISDTLHLVVGGLWPGMLLPFALFLGFVRRNQEKVDLKTVGQVLYTFSNLSLISVGLLALTGSVESYFTVGKWEALAGTDYGRIVLIKVFLFGIMVGIGFGNRYQLKQRFLSLTPGDHARIALLQSLRRNVLLEVCLAVFVLVAVGFLGMTSPPKCGCGL